MSVYFPELNIDPVISFNKYFSNCGLSNTDSICLIIDSVDLIMSLISNLI